MNAPPVTFQPYPYGSAKMPVNMRGQMTVSGAVAVTPRAPAYNPRSYSAQSNNAVQYGPAYVYDYLSWGAAGVGSSSYTFFQRAAGQSGVTNEDTNMQTPGNMGAGNKFIVRRIWVNLLLGTDYVSTGTDAAITAANALDDFKTVMNRGYFQFFVNNTPILGNGIGPLLLLAAPPQIGVGGGIGTGNAAAVQALAPIAINSGYDCTMYPFNLNDQLPFSAVVQFSGTPPTLPSTNATTKIGVIMEGLYGRPAS